MTGELDAPPLSVTINAAVVGPGVAKVCVTVMPVAFWPSPKCHAYATTLPSTSDDPDALNEHVRKVHVSVNEATGGVLAAIDFVVESVPPGPMTVSVTEYIAPVL